MFTAYRKIHIVVIAKLGINIYIHTDSYVGNEGIYIVFAPLGRMHTILVIYALVLTLYMSELSIE